MKRLLAILLILLMVILMLCACGTQQTTAPKEDASGTSTSSAESVPQSEQSTVLEPAISEDQVTSSSQATEQDSELAYGVYYLTCKDGSQLGIRLGNVKVNPAEELYRRFTIHQKTGDDGELYYALYEGDDENKALAYRESSGKVFASQERYRPKDSALWSITFADGYARLINKAQGKALAIQDGKTVLTDVADGDDTQLFKIEKAAKSDRFDQYTSKKGNIVIRVPFEFTEVKRNYLTPEFMQLFADHFQEAYEAEVALTGYIPYDVIVIDGWQDQNIVAGVVDNYNTIIVDKGFMKTEMTLMPLRLKFLDIYDMSFALLHEMGHMFDSQRAWNFESEAWTDLKLCYVIYKMTEDHKNTDGFVFGCAPADYRGTKECFTYEKMAECLNIHAKKGAMVTVYGFYGAAREFLLMAYDFGWDPFINTFHYFQDNGYTQQSFERWEKFTIFVEKLTEYSGVDVKEKYLSVSWQIFDDYLNGRKTDVV